MEIEKTKDILDYTSKHNKLRPQLSNRFLRRNENLDGKFELKNWSKKNCDWIIANDVSNKNIGFDSDFNEIKIFKKIKLILKIFL